MNNFRRSSQKRWMASSSPSSTFNLPSPFAFAAFSRLKTRVLPNRNPPVSTKAGVYGAVCLPALLPDWETLTGFHIYGLELRIWI